jgi:hypothetical protein
MNKKFVRASANDRLANIQSSVPNQMLYLFSVLNFVVVFLIPGGQQKIFIFRLLLRRINNSFLSYFYLFPLLCSVTLLEKWVNKQELNVGHNRHRYIKKRKRLHLFFSVSIGICQEVIYISFFFSLDLVAYLSN